MTAKVHTNVLIIGGGPVGLTLAADLGFRGVHAMVVERRAFKEPPNVKCNHVSSRTMEQFRRLGLAEAVRSEGLPPDYSNDIAFRISATGKEMARVHIPSRSQRYTDVSGPDGWWPTPEPPHRINQKYLEPLLAEHVSRLSTIQLRNGHELLEFEQGADGVVARVNSLEDSTELQIECKYLVGCDGGRSTVRRTMGAQLEGTAVIQHVQSTLISAPDLLPLMGPRPAWAYYALNRTRCGTVFAIDGRTEWLIHNHLDAEEAERGDVDRHASIRAILGVGPEFPYTVLSHEDWVARRLVATRLRDRRVFIAGDAAHLWIPQAGYGMNAGIADAIDLSWMLAARLRGWGGECLLDAYEAERLPITTQVSHFAMGHGLQKIKMRHSLPEALEDDGPLGEQARAEVGSRAYDLNVKQFCCAGLNFGYYYDASPVIVSDGETPPPYAMDTFTPSTVPGCRLPHFWLDDGRSLYDALGPDYTLLVCSAAANPESILAEAREQGLPLAVLDVSSQNVPAEYTHQMVICRPDQHVAWRGDGAPADTGRLVATLRGVPSASGAPSAARSALASSDAASIP